MEHRNVLVIGMFDSIHMARWLKQFEDDYIDFKLLPSKKFKYVNSELIILLKSKGTANYSVSWPYKYNKISGYIDFFFIKISSLLKFNFRNHSLKWILRNDTFDYVHALEIQGAGYLYSELPEDIIGKNKLILTNWGSDIHFFAHQKIHNEKISKIVSIAKYYSAECERDYTLLKNYNFTGKTLPCIPNSGGFSLDEINSSQTLASDRTLILCKGYGGLFGQAQLVIPAIATALAQHEQITSFFYSVTADIENSIKSLQMTYGDRVNYSTVAKSISREELLDFFGNARIYIGCSRSDGISTSFLEALIYGAYPIQTNTSCANEWIDKGAHATLIGLRSTEISEALHDAIMDDDLVNLAQADNRRIARQHLDENKIRKIAKVFYSL